MVQALQDFTAQGDDEGLSRAVEVFDELVECVRQAFSLFYF